MKKILNTKIESSRETPKLTYLHKLSDVIEKDLSMVDYGNGLSKGIHFIIRSFSLVRNAEEFFPPSNEYNKRRKYIVRTEKLSFDMVLASSQNEIIEYISLKFLDFILDFEELGVEDFAISKFHNDVKEIFIKEKFIPAL